MTNKGLRKENPYWGNVLATFGGRELGCGQQAGRVIEILNAQQWTAPFNSHWTFEFQHLPLNIHVWGRAVSNNPNDPVVTFDPWHNIIGCGRGTFGVDPAQMMHVGVAPGVL